MNESPTLFDDLLAAEDQPSSFTVAPDATAVEETLRHRGWTFLKVSGQSMFPWIRPCDVVFLRRTAIHEIHRGDVVVFEKRSALCMHRVLSVRHNAAGCPPEAIALLTKGDAVADLDEPVLADALRGKVEFVYRHNKELKIAAGWRKYFSQFLAFASPFTEWWRPAVSRLNRAIHRTEFSSTAPSQHSSEHSAD